MGCSFSGDLGCTVYIMYSVSYISITISLTLLSFHSFLFSHSSLPYQVPDIADPTSPPPDETDKKRTKRPKAKGRPDEDLFGNTDDIFSEVPNAEPKKTVKKKKKKVVSTTEEAADGEGTVSTTCEVNVLDFHNSE